MQDLLSQLLQAIITVCTPIIAGYAVKYLNARSEQAKIATESEIVRRYISEATKAVSDAVLFTAQTYVDELKDTGEFTIERQKQAFRVALDKTKELLTVEAKEFLEMTYGDLSAYLATRIEAEIKGLKAQPA